MKNLLFVLFTVFSISVFAQSDALALKGSTWSLQRDEMIGIGIHHNLATGTLLHFSQTDEWTLSEALLGYKQGKWGLDKKGRTVLYFGDKKRGYYRLEAEQLILILPGVGKERKMVWVRK